MALKIFVDSDVTVSSLISQKGAAYLLIHKIKLDLFVSNLSVHEMSIVSKRLGFNKDKLGFNKDKLDNLIRNKFKQTQLKENTNELKKKFKDYVMDVNDAHIIAGAVKAKVRFLITYNHRHFKVDKIKQDFGIIVITPANLIQYLRSRD